MERSTGTMENRKGGGFVKPKTKTCPIYGEILEDFEECKTCARCK